MRVTRLPRQGMFKTSKTKIGSTEKDINIGDYLFKTSKTKMGSTNNIHPVKFKTSKTKMWGFFIIAGDQLVQNKQD